MKSDKTFEMEEIIALATSRPNRIGCAEVALDDEGVVDYICMDLGGEQVVRCYELKITKSDFLSDAKKTFIGEFNYYVIPAELWMDVKNYVEPGIGVWLISPSGKPFVKKKATRMRCKMSKKRLVVKIMRALNREYLKVNTDRWRSRQLGKRVHDQGGLVLELGDVVEYHGGRYRIVEIDYSNEGLELVPSCVIEPLGPGKAASAPPGIMKKVPLHDIIGANIEEQ